MLVSSVCMFLPRSQVQELAKGDEMLSYSDRRRSATGALRERDKWMTS